MTTKYDGPPPEGCSPEGNDTGFHMDLGVGQPWHDQLCEDTYQATLARLGYDKMGNKIEPAPVEVTAKVPAAPTLSKAIAGLLDLVT